jgi:hypothetical protein
MMDPGMIQSLYDIMITLNNSINDQMEEAYHAIILIQLLAEFVLLQALQGTGMMLHGHNDMG